MVRSWKSTQSNFSGGDGDDDDEGSDGDLNSDSDSNDEGMFYSCPATRAGESTDCTANCLLHSHCTDPPANKCCYNGCGYSCVRPHRIPYIDLSSARKTECPAESDVPCFETTGSCREDEFACDDDDDMCCDNDCGIAVCVSTELDSPCFTAVEIALNNTSDRLGVYRPQCTTRGLFREIQCHAHFCWCVESDSGIPKSEIVPFEQTNQLACAGDSVVGDDNDPHISKLPYEPKAFSSSSSVYFILQSVCIMV